MSKRKQLVQQLIKEFDLKDTSDISSMFKELMGDTIHEMLQGELEEELGYPKHEYASKDIDNSRNGFSEKTLRSDFGDISISVPRNCKGSFELQIALRSIKKIWAILNNKSLLCMPKE